jgi:cell filamentation protein
LAKLKKLSQKSLSSPTGGKAMSKISIRFFDDKEVRAVWDDINSKRWFSVVDVVGVLSRSADARNYRYVLKSRLKKAGSEYSL